MPQQKTATITERRASYPLQQRLKIYNPDTMARRLNQEKTQGKLVVNGVNILNKSCLDKDIILDRMKQRRETHNRVERRRRDMLVRSFFLFSLFFVPFSTVILYIQTATKKRKGKKILPFFFPASI